jgi:hypothetical protein
MTTKQRNGISMRGHSRKPIRIIPRKVEHLDFGLVSYRCTLCQRSILDHPVAKGYMLPAINNECPFRYVDREKEKY